jgi:hypothetical protein
VSSKLGNFTRRFLADVNADADDGGEGADENEGHEPRRDVSDPERPVEGGRIFNRGSGVEENFRYPRDHDQNEDENVIAFQSAPDCLELGDFETRQNQIFANQLFPFALKHLPIFHDHRDEKMRLEHPDAGAERVVKAVAPRFDPKHHPDDGEIEKENDVRHLARGERDRDDGGAARDRPVGGDVEPLPPDHDPPQLAAVKMRHRIDVTRIVQTFLPRDGRLVARFVGKIFCGHGGLINWINVLRRQFQQISRPPMASLGPICLVKNIAGSD